MSKAKILIMLSCLFAAAVAWAARPRATVSVVGSVTPAVHAATEGAVLSLQCPAGIVWYRTVNDAELATPTGLVSAGRGMIDGGAFGNLVDFTSNGDPVIVPIPSGQSGIALLGTDAGLVTWGQTDGGSNQDAGVLPCFIGTP